MATTTPKLSAKELEKLSPRERSHLPLRRFDYADALRRYAAGETVKTLSERYGVSDAAVRRIVIPGQRERVDATSVAWQKAGVCPDCGAQTTRHKSAESARCKACAAKLRVKSVRETELKCFSCKEWKTDASFPRDGSTKGVHRRGRKGMCSACGTIARQNYRERQKIPCVRCGAPCLPAREKGSRGRDTGLCRNCYAERLTGGGE